MNLANFKGLVRTSVPLGNLTTWRIGGPADWLLEPVDVPDLQNLLKEVAAEGIPWFILGNGSNVLFSDKGFRGVVIRLVQSFRELSVDNNILHAGAGVPLHYLAQQVANSGLSGLEALAGIPGSVGGAAWINASAYGQSFLDVCQSVHCLDSSGNPAVFTEYNSKYRNGGFPRQSIITSVVLTLSPLDPLRIHELMNKYLEQRWSTQPVSEASAGCTFKNPEGSGAGRLIDRLGLKGFQIGRAMISKKHANFIINTGEASADDVKNVIRHVREQVWKAFRVRLEPEVVILDEWGSRLNLEDVFQ